MSKLYYKIMLVGCLIMCIVQHYEIEFYQDNKTQQDHIFNECFSHNKYIKVTPTWFACVSKTYE